MRSSVLIHRIVLGQTGRPAAGLLYASNPNLLYLGVTAMTEAPFLLFFIGSAYLVQRRVAGGAPGASWPRRRSWR